MVGVTTYDKYNKCSVCNVLHPKDVFRCFECGRKIRTGPRHVDAMNRLEWKGY